MPPMTAFVYDGTGYYYGPTVSYMIVVRAWTYKLTLNFLSTSSRYGRPNVRDGCCFTRRRPTTSTVRVGECPLGVRDWLACLLSPKL